MILPLLVMVVCAALLEAPPSPGLDPARPIVIRVAKDGFRGKEHLSASVENRSDKPVRVRPAVTVERSNGDGTWEQAFRLRLAARCPDGDARQHPIGDACVTVPPKTTIPLPEWDFFLNGDDQCPPRPPGLRAFKGAYRLVVSPCQAPPEAIEPAIRHFTWE